MRAPSAARLLALLAPLTLIGVAIAQLWPGLSADLSPPISWDHGSHFGKAALVWDELLPWLRGWTDRVEAGVPQHTLYTPTGTIWILLFRLFTPHLEWHQTYALAFVGFRALVSLSVYRLARVAGAGRIGALAAGLLMLADWGDHSEGGWFYDVLFGVWPMALAMSVFFLGLADLLAFLDGGRRAQGARAMALLGIALFSHQASLLALGAIGPALLVMRAVEQPHLRRDVARLTSVFVVAGLVACWWMLPMFAHTAWMDDHGQLYRSAPDIGARFLDGTGILNGGPWVGPLVGLGLLTGVLSRGHRRVLAVGALIAMLISTPGWLLQLDMVRWLPPLGRIVFPRMMMIAKPLLFALAGCVVHDLVARVAPMLARTWSTWRGRVSLALTLALCAPFLADAPETLARVLITREATYTSTLADWEDRRAAWAWLRAQPSTPFFRVLHFDQSTHLPQAAPAFSGHPGIIHGVLVGEAFRNTPDTLDPDALRAINVRYVVATSLPGELRRAAHEVQRFGGQRVFELDGWTGAVVVDASTGARADVTNLERERVVFDPRGAREVVVRRAFAPGWRAYANGRALEITPEPVPGSARLRLMRVAVPEGASRVELRYGALFFPTAMGMLLTLIGALVIVLYAAWPRVPERHRARVIALRDRVWARVPSRLRANAHLVVIALPFLAILLAMLRAASGHHFAYDLERARVSIRHDDGRSELCTDTPQDDEGWQCASAPHVSIRRTSQIVDGWFRGCITAHPPPSGTLVIEWPEAPLRGALRVGAGISDETHAGGVGAPLALRVIVDDTERAQLVIPNGREWVQRDVETDGGTHALRFEIDAEDPNRRWLCFDAVSR
ncbi:6-pyruvoyl-tetrahydropterin synthase-related protein [Sandaracinus amylolyticus]|uniref:Membrane protein 6-pyruvoyl-tetrahydropterin synthase-related domain-containing protein n=1 Tax=Sandaracinus amylolyticus TaxID=927083 RepID=A0A0F6W2V2_9BACT|nr:6-pyruvoyl-tetrahydropterin synthase-related protein [Sandaracinus amylolyticus]AKF05890.1 hypothetical protein DB32_003039 [Sandaracinus amylolyticus]